MNEKQYFCKKCKKMHRLNSGIGQAHAKYAAKRIVRYYCMKCNKYHVSWSKLGQEHKKYKMDFNKEYGKYLEKKIRSGRMRKIKLSDRVREMLKNISDSNVEYGAAIDYELFDSEPERYIVNRGYRIYVEKPPDFELTAHSHPSKARMVTSEFKTLGFVPSSADLITTFAESPNLIVVRDANRRPHYILLRSIHKRASFRNKAERVNFQERMGQKIEKIMKKLLDKYRIWERDISLKSDIPAGFYRELRHELNKLGYDFKFIRSTSEIPTRIDYDQRELKLTRKQQDLRQIMLFMTNLENKLNADIKIINSKDMSIVLDKESGSEFMRYQGMLNISLKDIQFEIKKQIKSGNKIKFVLEQELIRPRGKLISLREIKNIVK